MADESRAQMPPPSVPRLRFDRNELAGSFGDIGTDLPLLVAMIPAAGLDPASVFTVFGALQILTGLVYGLPMPMQPLKAMAVLVITHKLSGSILYGAGIAIGLTMLVLSLSGALTWLARVIPVVAVRGIQVGLGLALASLALKEYVPAGGAGGYALAAVSFALGVALWGNRRYPAALFIIGLGLLYALVFRLHLPALAEAVGFSLPSVHVPRPQDVLTGLIVLALPQLPLSLSNSVIATSQTISDLFPQRRVSIRKLGITYGLLNLLSPLLGGVPVCHGCGGLAGHYGFGARTGSSVVIYGLMFVVLGVLLGGSTARVIEVFPLPVLGVVLLFEAIVLMRFIGDVAGSRRDLTIALIVALLAFSLPNGFIIGLVVGVVLVRLQDRLGILLERHP